MVRSTKPSLLRRLGALVAAAAMLVVLPAGVSTASAASDDTDMLTVTMTRTDALGDEVYVGDTLTYSFTNTNNTSSAFTAFPAESNLSGVLTTGTPNCRYENLAGGASYPCSTASHTITADDLQELVTLKELSAGLMKRIHGNYRKIVGINTTLIVLGAMGILTPSTSALLHNMSTLGISLKSMENLLPETL